MKKVQQVQQLSLNYYVVFKKKSKYGIKNAQKKCKVWCRKQHQVVNQKVQIYMRNRIEHNWVTSFHMM